MTITLELPPELVLQFQLAARMQGKDLSTFLLDSARQQLRRDVLPESDAQLLETINKPIPAEWRTQRDALIAEKSHRELTATELDSLTRLIDDIEMANAQRWGCIAELARRRAVSLQQIANELQIPLP